MKHERHSAAPGNKNVTIRPLVSISFLVLYTAAAHNVTSLWVLKGYESKGSFQCSRPGQMKQPASPRHRGMNRPKQNPEVITRYYLDSRRLSSNVFLLLSHATRCFSFLCCCAVYFSTSALERLVKLNQEYTTVAPTASRILSITWF